MPTLLVPAFLLGLLGLLVPVLVHLMHRERRQALQFPSLMFLRRIPFRSVRRQKLRHLLLFAARCLALALLALAFARPFFAERSSVTAPSGGARALVILLDRSYSMGYGDRFARARQQAGQALAGLTAEDEAGLILFAERAEGVVPPTREHARVRAGISAAGLSSAGTRFAPALKLAQEWLAASERPRRELVLISDCQRRGLEGLDEVRLPERTLLRVVSLAARDSPNAALSGVTFDRQLEAGRERIAVTARVVNKGGSPLAQKAALEIGGRTVEEKPVQLPADGAASVTFQAVAYPTGATRGRILLDADQLPADNAFHFVLAPGQELGVLVTGEAGTGLYLRRALAIGDRPRFRLQTALELAPADLAGKALVVAAGAPQSEAAGAALAAFVRAGGGLIASLSQGPWRGAAAALGPGAARAPIDRTADRGATLATLELDHPALELFKAPRSGDFSAARFLRYRPLEPAEGDRVLARFDDGNPALVERVLGKGRVVAFASGFDTLTNDLALQPVFLPLAHQLARHVAGHHETRMARSVGEVVSLASSAPAAPASVTTPSGERVRPEKGQPALELLEAGFYELQRDGGPQEPLAVNVDTAESDLAPVDAEELQHALSRRTGGPVSVGSASLTPEDAERRQSLWWYLLAAALLLLLAETLLSNRLSVSTTAG
jgi:hypothetical protein